MNETIVILDISTGSMIFIGLALFYLGICFVAGMRNIGTSTIEEMHRAIQKLEKHIRG